MPSRAESAPIPSAGERVDPLVRVLLRRLQITDRIDVSLSSAYGLRTEQGTELYLPGGSQLSFQLKKNSIFVYCGGLTLNGGGDLTLTRYADQNATEIGFRRVNYPALYQGDLRLKLSDGVLWPILTLHVEDYLLGVVPYEMSNSFPLEALKAQTVAASTYALRKRGSGGDYDVVDTTNDQVLQGVPVRLRQRGEGRGGDLRRLRLFRRQAGPVLLRRLQRRTDGAAGNSLARQRRAGLLRCCGRPLRCGEPRQRGQERGPAKKLRQRGARRV